MKPACVYLAGPITGCTYDEARLGWRQQFESMLRDLLQPHVAVTVHCLSPMRRIPASGRNDLDSLSALGDETSIMGSARGITKGDRFDVQRADILVVNFLGARKISAGTMIELGWADAWQKPIVVAMEPDGRNPNEHAMVQDLTHFRAPTLALAARCVAGLLSTGL